MFFLLSEPEKESSSAKKKKHKKVKDFVLNITVPLECSFVRVKQRHFLQVVRL